MLIVEVSYNEKKDIEKDDEDLKKINAIYSTGAVDEVKVTNY